MRRGERRRHRCRGVIDCKGRGDIFLHLSSPLRETRSLQPTMLQSLCRAAAVVIRCSVACLWLRKQILADCPGRRTGARLRGLESIWCVCLCQPWRGGGDPFFSLSASSLSRLCPDIFHRKLPDRMSGETAQDLVGRDRVVEELHGNGQCRAFCKG